MEFYFQSDVGKKRNTNQDYAAIYENKAGYQLAILADGMGGHQAGDVASEKAVTTLGRSWEVLDIQTTGEAELWLNENIQQINHKIYELGQTKDELNGMGTTIVALALFDTEFTLAHVGDSRAYRFDNEQLTQITEDHSLVNVLVKSGEITEEMAAVHPRRNVLTRSIGMLGNVEIDIATQSIHPNEELLLCSDGLTNMLTNEQIIAILQSSDSLQVVCEQLITAANNNGGIDNITVLLLHLGGDTHE